MKKYIIFLIIELWLLSNIAFSQIKNFTVRIATLDDVNQGSPVEVSVYLESPTHSIGKIDLLITYDTNVFSIKDVLPGPVFFSDSGCAWEYIGFRHGQEAECGSAPCPSGIIQITAEANINNTELPNCWNVDSEAVVFTMKFFVTNDRTFEGRFLPINFIWYNCGNNTILFDTTAAGIGAFQKYAEAENVYFDGRLLTTPDSFPSTSGLPNYCYTSAPKDTLATIIDFHNGGVTLCCYHMIDESGDVNLNGLANEFADYNLFQDYFLYGISIFTVNIQGQIASTDVNHDGVPSTLEDLIYLERIIAGDLKPVYQRNIFSGAPPANKKELAGNCSVKYDTLTHSVILQSDSAIYAIWLQAKGNIAPLTKSSTYKLLYNYLDHFTNVLLFEPNGFETGKTELFRNSGRVIITEAQAATYDGNKIRLIIER